MYQFEIEEYDLKFIKPAKTSRNIFVNRKVFFVHLFDTQTGRKGLGESAPLSLLSIDDVADYEVILTQKVKEFCEVDDLKELDFNKYPSIRFGLETALLDLQSDSEGRLYDTPFTRSEAPIKINGLVWMNDADTMYQEALDKIKAGFDVIKFKVGALDFDEECRLLEKIRKEYDTDKVTLRLDANGAFKPDEAVEQLKELSRFHIHSIEQPIGVNLWDDLGKLCRESPIRIALDEELIGLNVDSEGVKMLRYVNPQFIILKPNLIGGVSHADKWISAAQDLGIGWWATSALESNIGLNAITQWVSQYANLLPQGLGTGALFSNNIENKLLIEGGYMKYVS